MRKVYAKKKDHDQVPGQAVIPRPAVYAVLSTVLPEEYAKQLAGYSPNSSPADIRQYSLEVADIRKKLTNIPGLVSYVDQIARAVEIMSDPEATHGIKLDALKEVNKMQGYLAPQKVEMESRIKISGAVMELKAIMGSGLTPQAIFEEKRRREIRYEPSEKEDS